MPPRKQATVKGRKNPVKRYHAYAVFLCILGTLFPPLAVAARFGIGKDFWINLLLTICGYIPGHGHNFYIQNIRNNKTHRRTPKWAQRYGLVDTTKIQRDERKSQWASRYNERLSQSALDSQPYEEGQEPRPSTDLEGDAEQRQENGDLWRPEEESFYGVKNGGGMSSASTTESTGRWRYPANFEDATGSGEVSKRSKSKKKEKKDRWARTEDAYSLSEEQGKKKKSKKKKSKSSDASLHSGDSVNEFPEDPEGGLYGDKPNAGQPGAEETGAAQTSNLFEHQF